MSESPGSASKTILLQYLTELPLLVPLYAFQRGHWNVAWFSLLHFDSPVFSVLVGGCVTWTVTGTEVKFHFANYPIRGAPPWVRTIFIRAKPLRNMQWESSTLNQEDGNALALGHLICYRNRNTYYN